MGICRVLATWIMSEPGSRKSLIAQLPQAMSRLEANEPCQSSPAQKKRLLKSHQILRLDLPSDSVAPEWIGSSNPAT